ncbi:uncharacterized protein PSFLO_05694 [Pseudozyma flocculosa]|uniref:Uncharacterized protein n=1 Tax=Pseudozyma flocculosa TaxID=84751 RepID=A0A5C3F754_9BASI|nr:uncharacterized protein PSFLO_05694 [Pseudozyma flocculosa]
MAVSSPTAKIGDLLRKWPFLLTSAQEARHARALAPLPPSPLPPGTLPNPSAAHPSLLPSYHHHHVTPPASSACHLGQPPCQPPEPPTQPAVSQPSVKHSRHPPGSASPAQPPDPASQPASRQPAAT